MRKVLSFVLVLALVLSSFSMAFAAETTTSAVTATTATTTAGLSDISASANGQAIQVANSLGIVTGNPDGTFQPEKAVNRAEFAAMITRALGIPQSALAGYTSTNFKDTNGYSWAVPYLAFCQSKGIMLGDGKGNAMPGRTINTNEAATMILRALGYTSNSSALVGVWPANYVSMAQDLGIYDDTASATNVDKQNAAQMIYNALTVQKVQVAADGTTKMLADKNDAAVTMLTSGLNCTNEGYKVIEYDANSIINTIPYVGKYAKVYTNSNDDIVAIDDVKSTTLKAKFKDDGTSTGALEAGEIFKDSADVEYTIKSLDGGFKYYKVSDDGKTITPADYGTEVDFVNGAAKAVTFTKDKEYTLNVKLSNKNIVEVYSIMDWTPDGAAKVVAGDLASIKDGKLLGYDFTQDKNDKIVNNSFELVGAKSLNDIKADSVVYVYKDTVRKEISKVAVGTQVVEGTVTKVNTTDEKWTVGGKEYKFAMKGENGSSKFKNELNNAVKLYLDAYGDIYKYDVTSGSAKDYATVLSYDTSGTSDGNMKIYLANDSKKTYSNDLDNWTGFTGTVKNTFGERLIGYSLNKSGEIDGTYPKFDKGNNTPVWGDNLVDGWYHANKGVAVMPSNTVLKNMTVVKNKNNDATNVVKSLVVDPDAVVFTYDTPTADGVAPEVNGVSKVANIEKHDTNKLSGQIEALVRDGKVVALIVSDADCSGSTTDSYAVVSAADQAVNSAGDKALVLTGFIDGKEMAKNAVYTSGTGTVSASGTDGYNLTNLYKLRYNDDKNISKMDAVTGAKVLLDKATVSSNGYTSDNYIKTDKGATTTAIATDAVYYEVVYKSGVVDEYKIYNGTIYSGMIVSAYETNDDKDGADVVIINKNGISTYSDPTFKVSAINATVASASATTVGSITSPSYANDDASVTDDFSIYSVSAGTGAGTGDFAVALDGTTPVITFAGTNVTTPGAVTVTVQLVDKFGGTALESFSFTFTN